MPLTITNTHIPRQRCISITILALKPYKTLTKRYRHTKVQQNRSIKKPWIMRIWLKAKERGWREKHNRETGEGHRDSGRKRIEDAGKCSRQKQR